jgi:hypothetical protein
MAIDATTGRVANPTHGQCQQWRGFRRHCDRKREPGTRWAQPQRDVTRRSLHPASTSDLARRRRRPRPVVAGQMSVAWLAESSTLRTVVGNLAPNMRSRCCLVASVRLPMRVAALSVTPLGMCVAVLSSARIASPLTSFHLRFARRAEATTLKPNRFQIVAGSPCASGGKAKLGLASSVSSMQLTETWGSDLGRAAIVRSGFRWLSPPAALGQHSAEVHPHRPPPPTRWQRRVACWSTVVRWPSCI